MLQYLENASEAFGLSFAKLVLAFGAFGATSIVVSGGLVGFLYFMNWLHPVQTQVQTKG